ncbi:NepR family anti-sigma factor [Salinarimonas soli]|uniref:Anti-sigma factor NepR domain-containing protein n=1 Tax=Salinarimonas soli TaxID=1638099 RepID=A0A5B2VFU1_9HYPH|nr:hypothetical protein F0L46_09405 [Salinarimonas soli]
MNDKMGKTPVDGAADGAALGTSRDTTAANPKLDRPTQGRIGDQLRAMYDDLLNQPVPDRFADLLSRLDKKKE